MDHNASSRLMARLRHGAALSAAMLLAAGCANMRSASESNAPAPTSLAGAYLAANLAAAEGDTGSAARFFADTLKQDPDNDDLLQRAFVLAVISGDMERARSLSEQVVAQDPMSQSARQIRAVFAMHDKNYAAAATENAAAGSGGSAVPPVITISHAVMETWIQAGLGNADAAIKANQSLASQQGVQGLQMFQYALLLDYLKRDDQAILAYADAVKTVGAAPRLVEAFGRFLQRTGHNAEAKALYARLGQAAPDMVIIKQMQADADRKLDSLVRSPADGAAEGIFSLANALNQPRAADMSMTFLNLALYLRSDFDLARAILADRFESQQNYDAANRQYAAIKADSPYYNPVQIQIAINQARIGDSDKGIATLRAYLAKNDNDTQSWAALGDLLRDAERYKDAAEAYDHAISTLPAEGKANWNLYFARGVSLSEADRWQDAENDFKKALALSPDEPSVLNFLGYSWVDQGRNLNEAVAMLEKARALRPLDGYIADSVGWAYYKLQRYDEAAQTLESAVQLAPGTSEINDHLGDAYWQVGRHIEARYQWSHALSTDPDPKVRPLIERKLQYGLEAKAGS